MALELREKALRKQLDDVAAQRRKIAATLEELAPREYRSPGSFRSELYR